MNDDTADASAPLRRATSFPAPGWPETDWQSLSQRQAVKRLDFFSVILVFVHFFFSRAGITSFLYLQRPVLLLSHGACADEAGKARAALEPFPFVIVKRMEGER